MKGAGQSDFSEPSIQFIRLGSCSRIDGDHGIDRRSSLVIPFDPIQIAVDQFPAGQGSFQERLMDRADRRFLLGVEPVSSFQLNRPPFDEF